MERGGDGHSPSFRNGSPRIYAEPAIDWYLRAGDVTRNDRAPARLAKHKETKIAKAKRSIIGGPGKMESLAVANACYSRRMARWKEDRRNRALHEASHAVVARKLGLAVPHVTVRKSKAHAMHESATYLAQSGDTATRIEALEKDAIVSQAGYTADVYEYPHPVEAPDLFDVADDADTDTINTRSAVYRIVCLQIDRPFDVEGPTVTLERDVILAMTGVYDRVIDKAYALVDQNWRTIQRVAKHLERHGDINDQATLDSLM
jgi:hypothetical protein